MAIPLLILDDVQIIPPLWYQVVHIISITDRYHDTHFWPRHYKMIFLYWGEQLSFNIISPSYEVTRTDRNCLPAFYELFLEIDMGIMVFLSNHYIFFLQCSVSFVSGGYQLILRTLAFNHKVSRWSKMLRQNMYGSVAIGLAMVGMLGVKPYVCVSRLVTKCGLMITK